VFCRLKSGFPNFDDFHCCALSYFWCSDVEITTPDTIEDANPSSDPANDPQRQIKLHTEQWALSENLAEPVVLLGFDEAQETRFRRRLTAAEATGANASRHFRRILKAQGNGKKTLAIGVPTKPAACVVARVVPRADQAQISTRAEEPAPQIDPSNTSKASFSTFIK
jgi:hypothetical protein